MPHSEFTKDRRNLLSVVGSRIRDARKKMGVTQSELSRNCRMTSRALKYIEAGQRNFFEGTVVLLRLADQLEISLLDLLEGTYVPTAPLRPRK